MLSDDLSTPIGRGDDVTLTIGSAASVLEQANELRNRGRHDKISACRLLAEFAMKKASMRPALNRRRLLAC
jgi:hypothetical protein